MISRLHLFDLRPADGFGNGLVHIQECRGLRSVARARGVAKARPRGRSQVRGELLETPCPPTPHRACYGQTALGASHEPKSDCTMPTPVGSIRPSHQARARLDAGPNTPRRDGLPCRIGSGIIPAKGHASGSDGLASAYYNPHRDWTRPAQRVRPSPGGSAWLANPAIARTDGYPVLPCDGESWFG